MKTTVEILIYADLDINEDEGETLAGAKRDINTSINQATQHMQRDSAWLENVDFEMAFASEGEYTYKKNEVKL